MTTLTTRITTSRVAHGGSALALALALVACGGVKLGDRTLVAPVAGPTTPDLVEVSAIRGDGTSVDDDHGYGASVRAQPRVTADPAVRAARAATGCFVADWHPNDRANPSSAPIDPWRAVDHGRPRVLPHATGPYVDSDQVRCDAAHDHCLLDCAWLVTTSQPTATRLALAYERVATADGFDRVGTDEAFVAYRSLPVTRRDLDVGALVLVLEGLPPLDDVWTLGRVESIDWASEVLHVHGQRRDYPLASARIAVLSYTRGGKVEVVGGLRPDQLVIRPDELFLPRARDADQAGDDAGASDDGDPDDSDAE